MTNPSLRPRVPPRKTGEPFDPWHGSCGFHPPDIVSRDRNLNDGPKRLYERLVRWAGHNRECWYSFDRMAVELGKCVRQVKSDMAALERLRPHAARSLRQETREPLPVPVGPIFEGGDLHPRGSHQSPPDSGGEGHSTAHGGGKEVGRPVRAITAFCSPLPWTCSTISWLRR